MQAESGSGDSLRLLDTAGMGLAQIDGQGRVQRVNESFLRYLEVDSNEMLGREVSALGEAILSPEFWQSLSSPGSFRCLVPGRRHLLLAFCRGLAGEGEEECGKVVFLRPYSLEREFIRMRSRLNRNVVVEISEHISSVAVAGEIIIQPELQEDADVRNRFLSAFFSDLNDLSRLFSDLQEIAEPIPFPARVNPIPLDWKSLAADLLAKMKGLASEKNVSLSSDVPDGTPAVNGDYHWLSLALYGILNHAVVESPPLGEVRLRCRSADGALETTVEYTLAEGGNDGPWPPQTLFPVSEGDPGRGKLGLTDLALSRSILLLHRGEVDRTLQKGMVRLTSRLPA